MKKQLKHLLYIAVVLCVGASCKKEVPNLDCDDGTCCGSARSGRYKFIQYVENAPADFSKNGGFNFSSNAGTPMRDIPICDVNSFDVSNLKHTSTFGTNEPSPYKYRVWGKVYQSLDARSFADLPVYMINVEKVEEAK